MKDNYKLLGDYIRQVDERNKDLSITKLNGVSINKKFIPSIANIIGTDLSNYKIVRIGQFAYGPVTSRNGDKISVAYLEDEDCIVSSSYMVFEVTRKNELDPEYLMLWFCRPEFDRYARYRSHGSVREIFDWEEMCMVEIPVPDMEEQRRIVRAYKAVTDRIALKQRINGDLEATAQTIFCEKFAPFYGHSLLPYEWKRIRLDCICTISGGKRLPSDSDLIAAETKHPYIRVRDIGNEKYVYRTNQFLYIDDETYNAISRYTVSKDDIVMSIVGTIGLIGIIHSSLDGANLTENCVKLSNIKNVSSDYLYHTLCYKRQIKEIDLLTVGAVQSKLPIYNIQAMEILLPPKEILQDFQIAIDALNRRIQENMCEIQKLKSLQEILLMSLSG